MATQEDFDKIVDHLRGFRKVVINSCYGGYGLSKEAVQLYLKYTHMKYTEEDRSDRWSTDQFGKQIVVNGNAWDDDDIPRDDPILIKVIEELGNAANGNFSKLKIIQIPADVEWTLEEYDGKEWIAEVHRVWS